MIELDENGIAFMAVLATLVVALVSAVASVGSLLMQRHHEARTYSRDILREVFVGWFDASFAMKRLCFDLAAAAPDPTTPSGRTSLDEASRTFLELHRSQMDRLTQIRLLAPGAVNRAQEEVFTCHLMAAWAGIGVPYRWASVGDASGETAESLRDQGQERRQKLFGTARREMRLPGKRHAPWISPTLQTMSESS